MQKIAIVGFGVEGRGALKFILKDPAHSKDEIWILDRNPAAASGAARRINPIRDARVCVKTGPQYLRALSTFDLIIKSPGVSVHLPQIRSAQKRGARVISSLDLFFEHAKGTIIGITGTKGKSTTATLLYRMLKRGMKDAYLGGNIGASPLDIIDRLTPKSITVLELSSFQLQNLHFSPHIAVVLDVFSDHLDVHKSAGEYLGAKAGIVARQKRGDAVFYFAHNAMSRRIAAKSIGKKKAVSEKGWNVFSARDLKITGLHSFRNAVMAGVVARALGCAPSAIRDAARTFKGLPYRLALEKTFRAASRTVSIYNDSASTNPGATAAALYAIKAPKMLIIGGKDKNLDYSPVARALKPAGVNYIAIFGENKKKIARALSVSRIQISLEPTLDSALRSAKKNLAHTTGDCAIIFSPASASFDMFADYKARGAAFTKLVRTFFSRPVPPSRRK